MLLQNPGCQSKQTISSRPAGIDPYYETKREKSASCEIHHTSIPPVYITNAIAFVMQHLLSLLSHPYGIPYKRLIIIL